MFSAFVASPVTLCPISPDVGFEMVSPPRGRTQNRCENDSPSASAIGSIAWPTGGDLLQAYVTYLTAWCRDSALLTARAY